VVIVTDVVDCPTHPATGVRSGCGGTLMHDRVSGDVGAPALDFAFGTSVGVRIGRRVKLALGANVINLFDQAAANNYLPERAVHRPGAERGRDPGLLDGRRHPGADRRTATRSRTRAF